MKLKTPNPTQHPIRQSGGISVGTLLMVCVVILLVALGTVGYLLHKANSETAKMKAAKDQADAEALAVQIAATNAAVATAKAERQAKLAVSKARRDDFVARAKGVTNQLHAVLDRIRPLQTDLDSLRTGAAGQRAAAHSELVTAARGLFNKEASKLPKDFDANQRLESARRLILQVSQSDQTEFEPSESMTTAIDDIRKWSESASKTQDEVGASIKYLQDEGEIRVPPTGGGTHQTLQAAMDAQVASFQAGINKQTTATIETATASAEVAKAKAEAERIINEAKIQADRIKAGINDANKAQQDEALLKEAGTPEVRQILAVIASPGIMEADGRPKASGKPGPMSYNALVSAGCTMPGTQGMKNLYGVASHPGDRERPRWERKYGGVFMNYPERREAVSKAHDTLIRLGPYLVKAGVLEP